MTCILVSILHTGTGIFDWSTPFHFCAIQNATVSGKFLPLLEFPRDRMFYVLLKMKDVAHLKTISPGSCNRAENSFSFFPPNSFLSDFFFHSSFLLTVTRIVDFLNLFPGSVTARPADSKAPSNIAYVTGPASPVVQLYVRKGRQSVLEGLRRMHSIRKKTALLCPCTASERQFKTKRPPCGLSGSVCAIFMKWHPTLSPPWILPPPPAASPFLFEEHSLGYYITESAEHQGVGWGGLGLGWGGGAVGAQFGLSFNTRRVGSFSITSFLFMTVMM